MSSAFSQEAKPDLPGQLSLPSSAIGQKQNLDSPNLASGGQRVEEVLRASWSEIDLAGKLWEIPASRTKSGRPHDVPITKLTLQVLEEAKPLSGGQGLLFPQVKEPDLPIGHFTMSARNTAIFS